MERERLLRRGSDALPLVIILSGYLGGIWFFARAYPWTADSLAYCNTAVTTTKATYLFERYFTFYLLKWTLWPFDDRLAACGAASVLQHVLAIGLAYSIVLALAGRARAALAASLTALIPLFVYTASEFSTDTSAVVWGLAGIRLSLAGSRAHAAAFAAGFCAAAAIMSKVFGIVFAPAILLVLWPFRRGAALPLFAAGALAVVAIVALGDWVHLGDVAYHLDPGNYVLYGNLIQSKLEALKTPLAASSEALSLPTLVRSDLLLLYYLLIVATLVWLAGRVIARGVNDVRARAVVALLCSGVGILLLFAQSYVNYPGHTIQWNYVYCVLVPWTVAFCAAEPGAPPAGADADPGRWAAVSIAVAFVVVLHLVYLTPPAVHVSPAASRGLALLPPWLLLTGLAAGAVGAGRASGGSAARWIGSAIVGSALLLMSGMATEGANLRSILVTGAQKETGGFLSRYRALRAMGPVVPVQCDTNSRKLVFVSLMLSGIASDEDLMFLGEIPGYEKQTAEFFERSGAVREFSRNEQGFAVWTALPFDDLRRRARSADLNVMRVADDSWFGCRFYWMRPVSSPVSLRHWFAQSGKTVAWIALDPSLPSALSADLEQVSVRTLDVVQTSVLGALSSPGASRLEGQPAYLWTSRDGADGRATLTVFAIPKLSIERALSDERPGYAIVSRSSTHLQHRLAHVPWARLEYEANDATIFAIEPRVLEKAEQAERAILHVRSGDGTTGEYVITPRGQTFTLSGSAASGKDNIHFYLDRPGRFYLDDIAFGVLKRDAVIQALSPGDSTFELPGNWQATGQYSAVRVLDSASPRRNHVLAVTGPGPGGGGSVVNLTTPFFEYAGGPTRMTFRAWLQSSPPCVGRLTVSDLEWFGRHRPEVFSSFAEWLSRVGVGSGDLASGCIVDDGARAGRER